ncbi:DNA adenine methyltransferase YhdJ [termite gut metagenome]|uniref:DNA adenine methyltransferase YhdJ n=1 Tax=termite gut metagenome TaxID=433724 RepID=A0A5J4SNY0_9ZZZZ
MNRIMQEVIYYNEDCLTGMERIDAGSIDCILTDPPYLYLKNQKLDRPFDETLFFSKAKRILKDNGFIVIFGRGTSFYRWNTILADLGFQFKEEVIWDKGFSTSPLMPVSRVHESISICTKKNGIINKVKVPYLERKKHDIDGIITDIKRMKAILKNTKSLDAVLNFLENNKVNYERKHTDKFASSYHKNSFKSANVESCSMRAIRDGMNESTIIREYRERYTSIHPTQKPVRLLERLLTLVTKPGDLVLDPFAGSASTAIACMNLQRKFIGYEIDNEYYEASKERIKNHQSLSNKE